MNERRGDLVQLPLPVTLMCLLTSSASPPKYRLGPGLAALCLSAITLRQKPHVDPGDACGGVSM